MKLCSVLECGKPVKGKGYCQGHLVQVRKHGQIVRPVLGVSEQKICSIADCEEPVKSRGLCRLHYERMKFTGTTDTPVKSLPAIERILKRVIVDEKGCWNCSLGGDASEYPQVSVGRKMIQVHRYVYEYFKEKIPDGLFGCHKCNNKRCCNPDHIYIATNQENIEDAIRDGLIDFSKRIGRPGNNRKLNEQDILLIKGDSRKAREVAQMFKVSEATISNIRKGKIWAGVV